MAKMNMGRVILGGVVAGIVMDILGFVVDGMWLAPRWAAALKALGHPGFSTSQMVWFNLFGIALGILAVWVYAAIRPRFGAGAKTATCAAVAMWIAGALLPNLSMMWAMGLFGRRLTLYTTVGVSGGNDRGNTRGRCALPGAASCPGFGFRGESRADGAGVEGAASAPIPVRRSRGASRPPPVPREERPASCAAMLSRAPVGAALRASSRSRSA